MRERETAHPACLAPNPRTIAGQLRQRLLALEYPAFARCLCVLLEALGYEEAYPAGRQEWKGYNRPGGGGYDLEALLSGGLVPRRVVAQIKQFDSLNVHQRSVDELRGACLRRGAAEAILVTTSAFSKVVLRHALEADAVGTSVAPVRLIDGKELLGLLIRHRLGVRETSVQVRAHDGPYQDGPYQDGAYQDGAYQLEVDEAFFQSMNAKAEVSRSATAKSMLSTRKPQRTNKTTENLEWKLTIYLSRNGDPAENKPVKEKPCKKGGR